MISEELRKLGHDVRVIGPESFPFSTPMPGYPEIRLAIMPYKYLKKIIDDFAPDRRPFGLGGAEILPKE